MSTGIEMKPWAKLDLLRVGSPITSTRAERFGIRCCRIVDCEAGEPVVSAMAICRTGAANFGFQAINPQSCISQKGRGAPAGPLDSPPRSSRKIYVAVAVSHS